MSDAPIVPPPATPGATPEVMQELNLLAEEVRAMRGSADRAWKTTAIGFAVLLVAVGGYLHFLVYRPMKELLKPDVIVQQGFDQVDNVLGQYYGLPRLETGRVPEAIGKSLKHATPAFFAETVKPALEELKKDLPSHRLELTEQFRKNAPPFFDSAAEKIATEYLPRAREHLVEYMTDQANASMDVLDAEVDKAVAQVLFEQGHNLHLLKPENVGKLQARIESALEQSMAPVLDPVFGGITAGIQSTRDRMAELDQKRQSGTLSHEEKLEIRLAKLTHALFKNKAVEHEETIKKVLEPFGPATDSE
ncbi:MAG: hypothetical protein HYY93_14965 [Planctomycetes bacterium]|nr:hypothetical protein [Planctomycetota bacterium]